MSRTKESARSGYTSTGASVNTVQRQSKVGGLVLSPFNGTSLSGKVVEPFSGSGKVLHEPAIIRCKTILNDNEDSAQAEQIAQVYDALTGGCQNTGKQAFWSLLLCPSATAHWHQSFWSVNVSMFRWSVAPVSLQVLQQIQSYDAGIQNVGQLLLLVSVLAPSSARTRRSLTRVWPLLLSTPAGLTRRYLGACPSSSVVKSRMSLNECP